MPVSESQKRFLSERAEFKCEYCLLPEKVSIKKHEPDHIIPRKHGGKDSDENLAWACFFCNRFKGSEVAAFDRITGELFPIFNPRKQRWNEHFYVEKGTIVPKTSIGRVTILVLQLNRPNRILVRARLIEANLYP